MPATKGSCACTLATTDPIAGRLREHRAACALSHVIDAVGPDSESFQCATIQGSPKLNRLTTEIGREITRVSRETVRSWLHRGWIAFTDPIPHGYGCVITDHGMQAAACFRI